METCEIVGCTSGQQYLATYFENVPPTGTTHDRRVCAHHASADATPVPLSIRDLPEVATAERRRRREFLANNRAVCAEATFPGSEEWG